MVDCNAKSNDTTFCGLHCNECVTRRGCWSSDSAFASEEDKACHDLCYGTCDTYLGASSDLCNCNHGVCIPSCLSNCSLDSSVQANLTTCNTDCMATTNDESVCMHRCGTCIVDLSCWTDTHTAGSASDLKCKSMCYDDAHVWLGTSSSLAGCGHSHCISGCPLNCSHASAVVSRYNTCHTSCMNEIDDAFACTANCE